MEILESLAFTKGRNKTDFQEDLTFLATLAATRGTSVSKILGKSKGNVSEPL